MTNGLHTQNKCYFAMSEELRSWRLTPHSTTFQLYHGGQFYLWRKPVTNGLNSQNKCYCLMDDSLWLWCLTILYAVITWRSVLLVEETACFLKASYPQHKATKMNSFY